MPTTTHCEICKHREAKVFMIVQSETNTAKAHVCLDCFERVSDTVLDATVSEVSLQEFNETTERKPNA